MSAEFSSKLLLLRQNAGLSQKQAAADLGISQALLSHYEKGIRECHLDFAVKAAEYYNVSTDYMLGASSAKKTDALTDGAELQTDRKPSVLTTLRAIIKLSEEAESIGDENENFFSDFFSLCVKKYLLATHPDGGKSSGLCDLVLSDLSAEKITDKALFGDQRESECVNTTEGRADSLIKQFFNTAL